MRSRGSVRVFAAVLLVALLCATRSVAVPPLPAQIDDREFWRIVAEFSEPGGSFNAENFVSNEQNFQQVLTRLKETVTPGGAYLGVGPEQNFTYIAAVQPGIAFVIDIRRQNLVLHLLYKAAFEMAQDRADFLSILFSRPRPEGLNTESSVEALMKAYASSVPHADLAERNLRAIKDALVRVHGFGLTLEDLTTLDHVHHVFQLYGPRTSYASNLKTPDFTNGGGNNGSYASILASVDDKGVNRSFLATEGNFRMVKAMQEKNLVIPVVGDFGGPKAIRAVAQYLKDQSAQVSVFYLSNVEQYLFQFNRTAVNGGAKNFYESVSLLPIDSDSRFIRSSNNAAYTQRYRGFTSHLGSIEDAVQAFREDKLRSLQDVFDISR